jgi:hypothetical protein
MCAFRRHLMIILVAAWSIAAGSSAVAADIEIQGQVRSQERTPISMIKVSAYRDLQLLGTDYTREDGQYTI